MGLMGTKPRKLVQYPQLMTSNWRSVMLEYRTSGSKASGIPPLAFSPASRKDRPTPFIVSPFMPLQQSRKIKAKHKRLLQTASTIVSLVCGAKFKLSFFLVWMRICGNLFISLRSVQLYISGNLPCIDSCHSMRHGLLVWYS